MRLRGPTRTALEATVLLLAVLLGAWLIFRQTLYRAPPAPIATPAQEARVDEAIVVAVQGDVVGTSKAGKSSGVSVGQRLRADDSLRTARGGRTDLVVGGTGRVTVAESTQLTVRELTDKVHRFKISRGRIAVDYQPDGARVLRVENESGEAVAGDGRFRVRVRSARDKSSVLVATRDARGREAMRTIPCRGAPAAARIEDFAIRWRKKRSGP